MLHMITKNEARLNAVQAYLSNLLADGVKLRCEWVNDSDNNFRAGFVFSGIKGLPMPAKFTLTLKEIEDVEEAISLLEEKIKNEHFLTGTILKTA